MIIEKKAATNVVAFAIDRQGYSYRSTLVRSETSAAW